MVIKSNFCITIWAMFYSRIHNFRQRQGLFPTIIRYKDIFIIYYSTKFIGKNERCVVMKQKIIKFATRKDFRERVARDEAMEFLLSVRKQNTKEEIESEVRKIYESSLEVLSAEDSHGILLFGEISGFPFGIVPPKS